MSNIVRTDDLFHRTKQRVRDLGEVFTQGKSIDELLDLLAGKRKNFWADENLIFFEPTCGHGNIVLAIYQRRLSGFLKKAQDQKQKEPALFAVANAMNGLFAIDIDAQNIFHCRERLVEATCQFLNENAGSNWRQQEEFLAHFLCAIQWQIHENELLSALSGNQKSLPTKWGKQWLSENKSRALNFDETWVEHYRHSVAKNQKPIEFQRAMSFLKGRGQEFLFASALRSKPFRMKRGA